PEILTFWWKKDNPDHTYYVATEDFSFFTVNENPTGGWEQAQLRLPAGLHTIFWANWTNGGSSRIWLDQVRTLGYREWLGRATQTGFQADPDNDGLPNLLEFAIGSDPSSNEAGSLLRSEFRDGRVEFSLPEAPRLHLFDLRMETSSTLAPDDWEPVEAEPLTDGQRRIISIEGPPPGPGESVFYRLRIELK
ncbi:MAG: hypothetical protein AAF514_05895, partial [Verrucomicrobiota bacterium]